MNKTKCILLAGALALATYYTSMITSVKSVENIEIVGIETAAKPIVKDIPIEPVRGMAEDEVFEEKPEPETEPEVKIDPYAKELLACVIYQEAGSNSICDDCRRRVADVVLNRVESELFPNTIYEVLTQEYQYGLYYKTGIVWPERASHPTEHDAVNRAYRIAEEVLSGNHSDIYGKDYVWQAEFSQGINNIYCCGTYFGQLEKED